MSGGNVIAEYDGNHNLLRKFVYVPRVDEPVCIIDVVDSNEPYYYRFDGRGSFLALSDVNNVVFEESGASPNTTGSRQSTICKDEPGKDFQGCYLPNIPIELICCQVTFKIFFEMKSRQGDLPGENL